MTLETFWQISGQFMSDGLDRDKADEQALRTIEGMFIEQFPGGIAVTKYVNFLKQYQQFRESEIS